MAIRTFIRRFHTPKTRSRPSGDGVLQGCAVTFDGVGLGTRLRSHTKLLNDHAIVLPNEDLVASDLQNRRSLPFLRTLLRWVAVLGGAGKAGRERTGATGRGRPA